MNYPYPWVITLRTRSFCHNISDANLRQCLLSGNIFKSCKTGNVSGTQT